MQIRQRSGSSAIDGFIKKTGKEWADNNFDRYFRNEGKSKKPLLDEQAVRGRERKIMDHAASIVKAFIAEHKVVNTVPTVETSCKPLFVFNETGSGKSLLMSLGSADFPDGVHKTIHRACKNPILVSNERRMARPVPLLHQTYPKQERCCTC